jgi:hypothetical protein
MLANLDLLTESSDQAWSRAISSSGPHQRPETAELIVKFWGRRAVSFSPCSVSSTRSPTSGWRLSAMLKVSVAMRTWLSGFSDEPRVTLELTTDDGAQSRLNASFLVGCDGGRSFVQGLGIAFDGFTHPEQLSS